jgi:alpha-beta hydrolase superfamily lysophospholipase
MLRHLTSHPWRSAAIVALAAFVGLNLLAFMHAWSMTHFVPRGGHAASEEANVEARSVASKAWLLVAGVKVARTENGPTPRDSGLDYSICRYAAADSVRCESWHVPRADPRGLVILFHGYAGCKSGLLREMQEFHQLGYSTLLVDFRGYGGSEGNVTTIGYREALDVAAACDYAAQSLHEPNPILYGQSLGSAAILRAVACNNVKPRALVLECPFDRLLRTVEHRFEAVGVPSFPCAELLVFWGGVQQRHWAFAHNPVEYATSVTCPTLLMHGAHDPRVLPAEARAIFDALGGPKQLLEFPNLGHGVGLSSDPDLWRQSVASFLDGLADAQSAAPITSDQ